jgi:hypothetical protein
MNYSNGQAKMMMRYVQHYNYEGNISFKMVEVKAIFVVLLPQPKCVASYLVYIPDTTV